VLTTMATDTKTDQKSVYNARSPTIAWTTRAFVLYAGLKPLINLITILRAQQDISRSTLREQLKIPSREAVERVCNVRIYWIHLDQEPMGLIRLNRLIIRNQLSQGKLSLGVVDLNSFSQKMITLVQLIISMRKRKEALKMVQVKKKEVLKS
jgi:hypothetical protein